MEEFFGKPISIYTSDDAEIDGVLFDLSKINKDWKKGFFNYMTTNLFRDEFVDELGEIKMQELQKLISECQEHMRKKSNDFKNFDHFFSSFFILPSGNKKEVYICQNETGKYTLMYPSDY